MACFRPLEAWQLDSGQVVFAERGSIRRALTLPCGRCLGCRLVRQRSWALRILHESQMHSENCFVTLTYDDDHYSPSLNYVDYQMFHDRLRDRYGKTRYFVCGEYGEQSWRAHFHVILFGRHFSNLELIGKSLYRSPDLEALWPFGFSSIGDVTYQSAAYVAGYCVKKITGSLADEYYFRPDLRTGELVDLVPPFAHMSLKPGIGASWFAKYWKEVYLGRDGCVLKGGQQVPAPRYYDKLLERVDGSLAEDKFYDRYVNAERFLADTTPERLRVREIVANAMVEIAKERGHADR